TINRTWTGRDMSGRLKPASAAPDRKPGEQKEARERQDLQREQRVGLGRGEQQRAEPRVLRRDRDQVLLFSQPGYGVEDEVGVAGEVQECVAGKVRVADEQDRRLSGVLRRSGPGDDQGG